LPESTIRRLILLNKDETFSQAKLDGTSEYIKTLLGNAGYTNAEVRGLTEKDQEAHSVDVSFFIDPGKRVYTRRIEFRGNTRTTDEVLRREMRQMESAPASNARIQQSKVRLERLSYIRQVDVETTPVPGSDDQIDVIYSIEEQPSGTLTASLGYAEFSGLNLGFQIQQANWMGTGKQVGIGISRSQFLSSYSFNFTDPYFTPDGVSRGFSLFYRNLDTDRIGTVRFDTDTYGGQLQFGYPISEIARLGFAFGFENQSITTGTQVPQEIRSSPLLLDNTELVYISQDDFELGRSPGLGTEFAFDTMPITDALLPTGEQGFIDRFGNDFNNATIDLSWSRFTLNRGILATRGNSQTLRFEATLPGSDVEYFKIHYDAQAFRPLTKDFTLRFRTTLGYGDGYGELDELPFFENFYAGGFGSVRGFEQSTLGPKGTPTTNYVTATYVNEDLNGDGVISSGVERRTAYVLCDEQSDENSLINCEPGKLATQTSGFRDRRANAFGGNVLVEFGTELILPIPFAKDSRSMQLVAFVDAGNVFSTSCGELQENCSNVDLDRLSSAYGFGFSWLSAMGPLTFSISRPLNQGEFDRREAFQFTFGGGF
jgi:outer membrane protein insertion porin family